MTFPRYEPIRTSRRGQVIKTTRRITLQHQDRGASTVTSHKLCCTVPFIKYHSIHLPQPSLTPSHTTQHTYINSKIKPVSLFCHGPASSSCPLFNSLLTGLKITIITSPTHLSAILHYRLRPVILETSHRAILTIQHHHETSKLGYRKLTSVLNISFVNFCSSSFSSIMPSICSIPRSARIPHNRTTKHTLQRRPHIPQPHPFTFQ